ncbi:MAG: hypothetical protein J5I50_10615 [Chitinophagaceae bacterium]|nr:hypothetical protein [Chitinophagaceae bacterium]
MKQFKKFVIPFIAGILLLSLSPYSTFAQGGPSDGGCDPKETWAECCARVPTDPLCPIDGGVVALLAAGVGYGVKRARDSRKEAKVGE